jgi:hypothetical protein
MILEAPGGGFEPPRPQEATSCLVPVRRQSISRLAPYLARRPRHEELGNHILSNVFLLWVVVECKVSAICVFCKYRLNNLLYDI